MGWRDRMGPATFRGVPFFVETSERAGGRRTVKHEYPGRDVPFIEDLGQAAREFPAEGYVLGEDYLAARDALIAALEAPGPGELVHPYHGTRRVAVTSFRVRESRAEGGVATFSIEFAETPAAPAQPTVVPDAAGAVRASAAAARVAVGEEFLAEYAPGARPEEALAEEIRRATLAAEAAARTVAMETQAWAALKRRADRLVASAGAIASVPADILTEILALLGGFTSRTAVAAVYRFNPGTRPVADGASFDAVQRLVQRLALLRAAEIAIGETYDSYDAAVAARDEITSLIDEQAETAGDATYPALLQLRADLVQAIPGAESSLPRLLTHTPVATVPSLVLAHQLYGDVALELDLVRRNRVASPGFVPGGVALEVISRG